MNTTEYFLSKGSHPTADAGRCAMEWVAYLAGEPHSDTPQCVSPVLARFCIAFNDALPDDKRQKLRPYLARTIGTRGDGLDDERAWMATDWLIREYTPTWLGLAGLDEHAARLRSLPPILATESLGRAMVDLSAARDGAKTAGAAAWAAAGDAAWAAAGDAAWAAVRDAAWAAAGAAAWAAVRAVVRDAAWAAAGAAAADAAWDAARAAAGAAAWAAAWDAAWAAVRDAAGAAAWAAVRDAAWAAVRDALQPTVDALQASAFELLNRMLPTEIVRLPVAEDAEAICSG
jgi:hypothetical protein